MDNNSIPKTMDVMPVLRKEETRLHILETIRHNFDAEKIGEITIDTSFDSIGLDSLVFIKLVVALEDEHDFEFDDEKLLMEEFPSVKSMLEYVETKIDQ